MIQAFSPTFFNQRIDLHNFPQFYNNILANQFFMKFMKKIKNEEMLALNEKYLRNGFSRQIYAYL